VSHPPPRSTAQDSAATGGRAYEAVTAFALMVLIVFATALFGILTRPSGFLAAFWPVNALVIGVFVRRRQWASLPGWLGALAGFMAADLATGNSFVPTLRLTAINLAEIAVGYALFIRLRKEDQALGTPISILYLFAVCAAAAAVAASVATSIGYLQTGTFTTRRWVIWFVSEIASLAVTLPVVLTAPSLRKWAFRLRRDGFWERTKAALPFLALLASGIAGTLMGGPGVLAFPIPALLWCALNYNLFFVTLLTMLFSIGEIMAVSSGLLNLYATGNAQDTMISIRLGVTFLTLGPLTVSTINSVRNKLLRSLEHAASHDFLTNVLTRGAFVTRSSEALARVVAKRQSVALLMLDIDHFKPINDRYGHAVGDQMLAAFARTVSGSLRESDLFGRIGGEEFAVFLPNTAVADALEVAQRIRTSIESMATPLDNGATLRMTVSAGLADVRQPVDTTLDQLLRLADKALYAAKDAGRNQVAQFSFDPGPSGASGPASQFAV
jgi:diguanylate cyclase (GGDEF)-like protein